MSKKTNKFQLIGVAKILDSLWDNSYYSMGKRASDRIEREMIYYFGENWTTDMYDLMTEDGESEPSCHPVGVKTLKETAPFTVPNIDVEPSDGGQDG